MSLYETIRVLRGYLFILSREVISIYVSYAEISTPVRLALSRDLIISRDITIKITPANIAIVDIFSEGKISDKGIIMKPTHNSMKAFVLADGRFSGQPDSVSASYF